MGIKKLTLEDKCLDCKRILWEVEGDEPLPDPICADCLWKRYDRLQAEKLEVRDRLLLDIYNLTT